MIECTTGNAVAQADLDLRGPGDLLGARQTGALPLRFLRFVNDPMMIGRARAMAEEWLKKDAELATAASRGAKAALQENAGDRASASRMWGRRRRMATKQKRE